MGDFSTRYKGTAKVARWSLYAGFAGFGLLAFNAAIGIALIPIGFAMALVGAWALAREGR
jgi:hypothetical protein